MHNIAREKFFKITAKRNGYLLTKRDHKNIKGSFLPYIEAVKVVKDAKMERNMHFHNENVRLR